MALDWDYYRSEFIAENYDLLSLVLTEAKALTPIEGIVLLYLSRLKIIAGSAFLKIKTQYKIDQYTVDFLVEYKKSLHEDLKIIIECDGHEFHEKTKEQASKDKKRDRHLSTKGYTVLRYSGSDIVNSPGVVVDDIVKGYFVGKP